MPPTIRETYDLPKRTPVPVRLWVLPAVITIVALGGWFILPRTPAVTGILAVVILLAVGAGVWRILMSRQLSDLPTRQPTKPPSVGGD